MTLSPSLIPTAVSVGDVRHCENAIFFILYTVPIYAYKLLLSMEPSCQIVLGSVIPCTGEGHTLCFLSHEDVSLVLFLVSFMEKKETTQLVCMEKTILIALNW